ncbi:MAG: hypothetical protein GC202_11590 [Alphaproteobacteria bacterium]|nr:hypothetical protein [Alphaproteobacteria bacterium]
MTPSSSADSVRFFAVVAQPDVGLPARVLDQFAKRDLLPERFLARLVDGSLLIDVECAGLDDVVAAHVRDVLSSLVRVERVDLDTYRRSLAA